MRTKSPFKASKLTAPPALYESVRKSIRTVGCGKWGIMRLWTISKVFLYITVVNGNRRIAIQQSENTRLWLNSVRSGCLLTGATEVSFVKSSTASSSSSSENPKDSPVYSFLSPPKSACHQLLAFRYKWNPIQVGCISLILTGIWVACPEFVKLFSICGHRL